MAVIVSRTDLAFAIYSALSIFIQIFAFAASPRLRIFPFSLSLARNDMRNLFISVMPACILYYSDLLFSQQNAPAIVLICMLR
jgi:hypothetical protein